MLENIILLIGDAAVGQDDLLTLLIKNAKSYAVQYCGLDSYSSSLDSIIMKMVCEDFNKRGSEGLGSKSFSGISESYVDGYSQGILNQLDMYSKNSGIILL